MKKERIEYIDIFRALAIIIMVLGHVGINDSFDKYIHAFHMPLWFFISGWLFNIERNVKEIVSKNFKNLILPYLIWGIIHIPLWIVFCYDGTENIWEPVVNLFLVNTNLLMPIAGALWFLTSLFFAELIFCLVYKCFKKRYSIIIAVLIALLGNAFVPIFHFRLPWAIDTSLVAALFIYVGFVLRKKENNKYIHSILNLRWCMIIPLLIINFLLIFVNSSINMRTGDYGNIFLFWLNSFTSIILYWNLSKKLTLILNNKILKYIKKILVDIGKNSIVFLCLNQLCIRTSIVLLNIIDINLNLYINKLFIFTFSMILMYFAQYIFMNTKLRVMFGKTTRNYN